MELYFHQRVVDALFEHRFLGLDVFEIFIEDATDRRLRKQATFLVTLTSWHKGECKLCTDGAWMTSEDQSVLYVFIETLIPGNQYQFAPKRIVPELTSGMAQILCDSGIFGMNLSSAVNDLLILRSK